MNGETKPRVLIVYYSFTKQTELVADAMGKRFTELGCDVVRAPLAFTDLRHGKKFSKLPMHWPVVKIVSMLPAQLGRKTGEIGIPREAQEGDYDLVVFGSPTWWLTTNMPVRSYLESPAAHTILDGKPFAAASVSRRYYRGNLEGIRALGERSGGRWTGETHFVASGNQVMSMLSWLAFMFFGGPRGHFLGIRMPKPNLQPGYEEQARSFVDGLMDSVLRKDAATGGSGLSGSPR